MKVLIIPEDFRNDQYVLQPIIEAMLKAEFAPGCRFFAENAWQELEVWLLAGHDLPREWSWQEIRQERDPKERYFVPFARMRGVLGEPGGGRKSLAAEAASRYSRIRSLCPEDIAALEDKIRTGIV